METDVVARALRVMAMEYIGQKDGSGFPPPKVVQSIQEEGERVICQDFAKAHPDLMELRALSTQLIGFAQERKRQFTIGKNESIKRLAQGIMDIFWAGVGLSYLDGDSMKLVMVDGKVALVESKGSPKHALMEAIIGGLQGHDCETM